MEKPKNDKGAFNNLLKQLIAVVTNELSSWGGMYRILVFIIVLVSFLCAALLTTLHLLKNTGFRYISANGSTIIISPKTKIQQYLIDPRQPNATKIELKKGDNVRINVSGSVHIALGRIMKALQYEYMIKDSLYKAIGKRDLKYFNREQLLKSMVAYSWNGPTGIDTNKIFDTLVRNSIRLSQQDRLMPKCKVGQLIAFISDYRDQYNLVAADTENIIKFNTESIEFKVKKRGYLWFTINDDFYRGDDNDDYLRNLITMQDNLGFFSATITID
jgi:hypothetical protein